MSEYTDASINFEGVQVAMNKSKDGYILKLAIHPNDVPESLLRDLVGSRYMVAMVKLDDENKPVHPPERREQDRAVMSAGMLCRQPEFWKYLENVGASFSVSSEKEAIDVVHGILGISSRAELKTNSKARGLWDDLARDFRQTRGF